MSNSTSEEPTDWFVSHAVEMLRAHDRQANTVGSSTGVWSASSAFMTSLLRNRRSSARLRPDPPRRS